MIDDHATDDPASDEGGDPLDAPVQAEAPTISGNGRPNDRWRWPRRVTMFAALALAVLFCVRAIQRTFRRTGSLVQKKTPFSITSSKRIGTHILRPYRQMRRSIHWRTLSRLTKNIRRRNWATLARSEC